MAGKTNCPLGGAEQVIVEDNHFVSLFPTAYENIAGSGRNLYYARNRQEALHVHQADYSFTFDAGDAAYFGKIAAVRGMQAHVGRRSRLSERGRRRKATCGGRPWSASRTAAGPANGGTSSPTRGGDWTIDRPFDCPPDDTSLVTIVPMNGRVLVIGNRFEDANWVNASYGTAIDVVFAENQLYRCAQLLNYGWRRTTPSSLPGTCSFSTTSCTRVSTSIDTTGSVREPAEVPLPHHALHDPPPQLPGARTTAATSPFPASPAT